MAKVHIEDPVAQNTGVTVQPDGKVYLSRALAGRTVDVFADEPGQNVEAVAAAAESGSLNDEQEARLRAALADEDDTDDSEEG